MRRYGPTEIDETFLGGLDPAVWVPAYMPAWSSTREAAATWSVGDDGLRLSIPPAHPRWCADTHDEPLRVSAVQSGTWSGPLGGTRGQQPFREGLVVREKQSPLWGFTPFEGSVEVEARASIGPGSMFSFWMVGLEDEPDRSGEICIVEVFGDTIRESDGVVRAAVGRGIHPFRDPTLADEFAAPVDPLDVRAWHRYGVEWSAAGVVFLRDGVEVGRSSQSPRYPMQLILGVFDFPRRTVPGAPTPELVVRRVRGRPRLPG